MPTPTLSNQGGIVAVEIVRSVPWAYTFTLKDKTGAAINIAGRTYAAQIRTAAGTLAATATCAIVDAAGGKVSVSFTGAQTAALTVGTLYLFSIEQTASGLVTELVRGNVTVQGDITE
jgi:hypothetical protein